MPRKQTRASVAPSDSEWRPNGPRNAPPEPKSSWVDGPLGALPKLKHDFALPQEAQLRARDALDGGGIVSEVRDVDAEARDITTKLLVLRVDLGELLLERSHSREPLWFEDQEGHGYEGDAQDADRQEALQGAFDGALGHGQNVAGRREAGQLFWYDAAMGEREFEVVVGLEVHAQLLTRTKLFCGCETTFGAEPNTHICPVCAGLPGALPALNEEAVRLAVAACLALGVSVSEVSRFSRKNYFYPDLPKGYQISQFDEPLGRGGSLEIPIGDGALTKHVRIERIHMEEDAGKNVHQGGASLVDLNRAGTPLIEIVGHPDLSNGREAADYLRALREILVFVGVNDGNLEEGSFRCDANVSVRRPGEPLGVRVELKNINSFRFVEKAIGVEAARQVELISGGGRVLAETRGWDERTETTFAMRSKETAQDYRYFPEPDLLPLVVPRSFRDSVMASLPEVPAKKRAHYTEGLGLTPYAAEVLTQHPGVARFFEEAVRLGAEPVSTANFVQSEVLADAVTHGVSAKLPIDVSSLVALLGLVRDGTISGKQAKELYRHVVSRGGSADVVALAESLGMRQLTDASELRTLCESVVLASPKQRDEYSRGKKGIFGYFVGQVMKASQGKANPKLTNEILTELLDGGVA